MLGKKVVVIGGVGFVGRAVVNELSKQGYETTVCVRRLERYREFALFPKTRLAHLPELSDVALNKVMAGQDILINLTADMTAGTEALEIDKLVAATQKIKQVADHQGIKRVIQFTQIGADANQASNIFLAALGEANSIMANTVAKITTLKAGLLIGEKDASTSKFVAQLNRAPILPVANAQRLVQPLSVQDFALALVKTIKKTELAGKKLELVGEERLSFKELAELVAEIKGQEDALVFSMCGLNAKIMAKLGGLAPIVSVTSEQLLNLSCDLVSDSDFSQQFGFEPKSLVATLAKYVAPHTLRTRYNDHRQDAGRNAEELI
ncbi:MAG: NAD(P)H-binding protein [Thiotrichales bacterium]|nr:NAD(P)H-binding protein [Thiotrichales bacterium]